MPNDVGNSVIATGPESEISRLVDQCFHVRFPGRAGEKGNLEFNFRAVIPIDDTTVEEVSRIIDHDVMHRQRWGTKWNAYDSEIILRRPGHINFEFNTAWSFPEPVYRELGRQFPELEFDIASMDPGECWAIAGRVCGLVAEFDTQADLKKVFERVYKEPIEKLLEPDT